MPGLSGIEAIAMMGPRAPYVIFARRTRITRSKRSTAAPRITSSKPVNPERLRKAIERARAKLAAREAAALSGRLAVTTSSGVVLVDPRSVTHATLDGTLVTSSRQAASAISPTIR